MFTPKESNVGGRSLINSSINNHWTSLTKAKSNYRF